MGKYAIWEEAVVKAVPSLRLDWEILMSKWRYQPSQDKMYRFGLLSSKINFKVRDLLCLKDCSRIISEIFNIPLDEISPIISILWGSTENVNISIQKAFQEFIDELRLRYSGDWASWKEWFPKNNTTEYLFTGLQAISLILEGKDFHTISKEMWISYDVFARRIRYALRIIQRMWSIFREHLINSTTPE